MSDLFGQLPATIPVISLWQPWASLCFVADPELRKLHETRHWKFPDRLRGAEIAIHAAVKPVRDLDGGLEELCAAALGDDFRRTLPRGAVLGVAKLAACQPVGDVRGATTLADLLAGNFEDFTVVKGVQRARFAWRLDAVRPAAFPVFERGKQGWWRIASDRLSLTPTPRTQP